MTTYRINCKNRNHQRGEGHVGTLDNLRGWLLEQATRWDWNLEGLQDLAEQWWNGENLPPATEDEVRRIAARVWDEAPTSIILQPA